MLWGKAFGAACATAVAIEAKRSLFECVILESPFTSAPAQIASLGGFVNKYLISKTMKNQWRNDQRVADIKQPLLFITGTKDNVIHPAMANELYNRASGTKHKEHLKVEGGKHFRLWEADKHFFEKIL